METPRLVPPSAGLCWVKGGWLLSFHRIESKTPVLDPGKACREAPEAPGERKFPSSCHHRGLWNHI